MSKAPVKIQDKYTFNQFLKRCPDVIDNHFGEKTKVKRSEDDELVDVMNWFKHNYPHHKLSIAHPVNEVKGDHGGYGKGCKDKGKLKGLHDILLFLPASLYGFATFELKRSDHKSSVDESQVQISLKNTSEGGYSCICWGFQSAKKAISEYMKLRGE